MPTMAIEAQSKPSHAGVHDALDMQAMRECASLRRRSKPGAAGSKRENAPGLAAYMLHKHLQIVHGRFEMGKEEPAS
jgi:hypothetical protein